MARVFSTVSALLACAVLCAADVWVSPSGCDIGCNGTQRSPFRTINYAISQALDGEAIVLVQVATGFVEDVVVSKRVSMRSSSTNTLLKTSISGTMSFTVDVTDVVFTNLAFWLSAPSAISFAATKAISGVVFDSCTFTVTTAIAGVAIHAYDVDVGTEGLTFFKCRFENRATVLNGTFALIDTWVTSLVGQNGGLVTFDTCEIVGNAPGQDTPTAAAVIDVRNPIGVTILMSTTRNGGMFMLDGCRDVKGNYFTGLGVVLTTAEVDNGKSCTLENNRFEDIGSLNWGPVGNAQAPASLTFALKRAGLFNAVLVKGNTFVNIHNTETQHFGAISVANEATWNLFHDSNIINNDFSGVAHTEFALHSIPLPVAADLHIPAQMNFWGDATGPISTCNPTGRGAHVDDSVYEADTFCIDNICQTYVIVPNSCVAAAQRAKNGAIVAAVIVSVFGLGILAALVWVAIVVVRRSKHQRLLLEVEPEEDPGYHQ